MKLESNCTLLVSRDGSTQLTDKQLKEKLESDNPKHKIAAMKEIIALALNGESQKKMIMNVMNHIQPQGTTTSSLSGKEDHAHDLRLLKKLALYFWEVVDKTDESGRLLEEMVLAVDFFRRDLCHPNEYIRGATLRFLCNFKEKEILEPLATTVVQNLEHRKSYVRGNAVLAVMNIYKLVPHALSDAPEIVEEFLQQEVDVTCKRNAFLMLFECAPERAVNYLTGLMESESSQGQDIFQLVVVELVKKLLQTNPSDKSYVKVIFSLLESKSQSVLFQCADTLLALVSAPIAIKASATTFISLLTNSHDNNIKLVIVGKLEEIKRRFPEALEGLTLDLLRCLSGSELEIQKRILALGHDLVTAKNVDKVVALLKKELLETISKTSAKTAGDYRVELLRFISHTAHKFKSVAPTIAPILLDFIVEDHKSANEPLLFIRDMVYRQPDLREDILDKLAQRFTSIAQPRVYRTSLWVLGTYAASFEEVQKVMALVHEALEPFPLWLKPVEEDDTDLGTMTTAGGGAVVRSDGTYGQAEVEAKESSKDNHFRTLITDGDFYLASILANTMVKVVSTCLGLKISHTQKDHVRKDALNVLEELIQLGIHKNMSNDSHESLRICKKLLENPNVSLMQAYTKKSLAGFGAMIKENEEADEAHRKTEKERTFVPVEQPVQFSQLIKTKRGEISPEIDLEDVKYAVANQKINPESQRLRQVMQLTGLDSVYVEGTLEIHPFDILIELLVVNKTDDTLQNLTAEFNTAGDNLRLCERPQTYTVGPGQEVVIKANMKVSSTEGSVIYGNIVYDSSRSVNEQTVVVLNDMHIDIIDYVHPASCNATDFRKMWSDFEWENKLVIVTDIKSLREYLDHIIALTNMKSLSTSEDVDGDADFLSAKLMAKSSFGEEVVANISMGKQANGNIEGYVRIRSRSQGIALGLGDKIQKKQKNH